MLFRPQLAFQDLKEEGPHLKSANVAWGNREGGNTLMIDGKSDTLDDKDNNDKVEIVSLKLELWIDYWYEEYRGLHQMISRLHLEFQDLWSHGVLHTTMHMRLTLT